MLTSIQKIENGAMKQSKWKEFEKSKCYKIVDLGRPAIFKIPTKKLKKKNQRGEILKESLEKFLAGTFGAYSLSPIPGYFGVWVDGERVIYDICTEYEVSFLGKEKIPALLEKLAKTSKDIGEVCIYFKAGQYACLVYPK